MAFSLIILHIYVVSEGAGKLFFLVTSSMDSWFELFIHPFAKKKEKFD